MARRSGGPQLSRPPPRGDGAAAASPTARTQPGSADGPTGTAQGRRVGADEMSDPASATLSAPPRERPTRAAWRPTTDFAPPKWAGSTLQPHAAGRRAGRVDRRRRRPYRNCGTGAPSASLLPSHARGRRDTALTVATASRWERARRGQPPRRLQGTRLGRLDLIRPDARIRPAEEACRTLPSGLLPGRPEHASRGWRGSRALSREGSSVRARAPSGQPCDHDATHCRR
jgi:hypothetical protein